MEREAGKPASWFVSATTDDVVLGHAVYMRRDNEQVAPLHAAAGTTTWGPALRLEALDEFDNAISPRQAGESYYLTIVEPSGEVTFSVKLVPAASDRGFSVAEGAPAMPLRVTKSLRGVYVGTEPEATTWRVRTDFEQRHNGAPSYAAVKLVAGPAVQLLSDATSTLACDQFSSVATPVSVWLVDAAGNVVDGGDDNAQLRLWKDLDGDRVFPEGDQTSAVKRGATGVYHPDKRLFTFNDIYVTVPAPGTYSLQARVGDLCRYDMWVGLQPFHWA